MTLDPSVGVFKQVSWVEKRVPVPVCNDSRQIVIRDKVIEYFQGGLFGGNQAEVLLDPLRLIDFEASDEPHRLKGLAFSLLFLLEEANFELEDRVGFLNFYIMDPCLVVTQFLVHFEGVDERDTMQS